MNRWNASEYGWLTNVKKGMSYQFDSIFGTPSTNQSIFDTAVKRLIDSALKGYDSSVFCYGQTGSGKTHTMYGIKSDPGIASRALYYLFETMQMATDYQYTITIGFLEIYNESVNDLLDPSKKNLALVETTTKGVTQIKGLTEIKCSKLQEAEAALRLGEKNRHIGITQINEKSSRSHTM